MIAILIMTILSGLGARKFVDHINDAAAESTGRYLHTVRSAVVKALSDYDAAFTKTDTSSAPPGTYPTPPTWAQFSGGSKTVSIKDLKDSDLLPDSFPDTPPLGRSAHVQILRTGSCPGNSCRIEAYVFTCWPMNKFVSAGAVGITTCPAPPAGSDFDINLVGAALAATEGYGGSNMLDSTTVRGPLFEVKASSLGVPAGSAGHVVVLASLNDSMFSQFVRQGDTRHIFLKDNLTVSKVVTAEQGINLPTNAVRGQVCSQEGTYGTSTRGAFSVCSGGRWFELNDHMLLSTQAMANNATLTTPTCGAKMQPFAYATLMNADVTMTGSDIAISGSISGGITGSGNVSNSGAVSVSGSFNGTTTSNPSSSIRVTQGVSIVSNKVVITPASTSARALVTQGCRYL
ncbi:hypothetical protein SJI00_21185 [Pseudomonas sp. RP23018S]|uniref:hypothetical protein n=1 Tax=Pseudomonas sp. RP23018S TaxID=3096037 RepID=UPI002ACA25FC|nr:hypothetical protein [Pseudomonas sp. RP23018S]MDZ5605292.1 hypothetical protein [Pseudomonas sp. RP23018S]